MTIEYEVKVLDIDVKEIEDKLSQVGAKFKDEFFFRRWIFNISEESDEWIRLRDDGKKVTLTYKHKSGSKIDETEEIQEDVEDFDKTYEILSKIKFSGLYYQESKRKLYILDDIEFTIDTWPLLKPYLEIESTSKEKVLSGLRLLNLEGKDSGNLSVKDVYKHYGISLHDYKELRFEDES